MGSDAAELVSLWEQQHANGTALGMHIAAGWVCAVQEAEQKLWACNVMVWHAGTYYMTAKCSVWQLPEQC